MAETREQTNLIPGEAELGAIEAGLERFAAVHEMGRVAAGLREQAFNIDTARRLLQLEPITVSDYHYILVTKGRQQKSAPLRLQYWVGGSWENADPSDSVYSQNISVTIGDEGAGHEFCGKTLNQDEAGDLWVTNAANNVRVLIDNDIQYAVAWPPQADD